MRYTIYEHPVTRMFALLPLPPRFIDGDALPIAAADRWFASHADAVAALPGLLSDPRSPEASGPGTGPSDDSGQPS
jgi:hypothetical protein